MTGACSLPSRHESNAPSDYEVCNKSKVDKTAIEGTLDQRTIWLDNLFPSLIPALAAERGRLVLCTQGGPIDFQ